MCRAIAPASGTPAGAVRFYTSSGGNAGLACATAARTLGHPATVAVPLTTPPHMVAKLRGLGAEVVQAGGDWAAADRHLREVVIPGGRSEGGSSPAPRAVYVPPFDHKDVWDGAETLVGELRAQVPGRVDGIACSVGGGGLLCGVMQGVMQGVGGPAARGRPRVLAVETEGAGSLNASVRAGRLVTLPAITSIATSLGATRVAPEAYEWTRRAGAGLVSAMVTDRDAVVAMTRFLDDARMLVESACGATIATAYNGDLRRYLGEELTDEEWATKNVVLVVCGGSNISLGMLEKYRIDFGV